MLNEDEILARANMLYAQMKRGKGRLDEPVIQSDQVKAILKALVEALNDRVPF